MTPGTPVHAAPARGSRSPTRRPTTDEPNGPRSTPSPSRAPTTRTGSRSSSSTRRPLLSTHHTWDWAQSWGSPLAGATPLFDRPPLDSRPMEGTFLLEGIVLPETPIRDFRGLAGGTRTALSGTHLPRRTRGQTGA